MKIISWNLNGRVRCVADQLRALHRRSPDVVAVQEVRESTLSNLQAGFARFGLVHCADSLEGANPRRKPAGPRRIGVMVASRWPLEVLSAPPIQWQERLLSVRVSMPRAHAEVHTTHVPPGATNGWTKIYILEQLFEAFCRTSRHPRILCGDFNLPWEELMNGEIITCGQRELPDGSWIVKERNWRDPQDRVHSERRWDKAERNIMQGWPEGGFRDVYRFLHVQPGQAYRPDKSWLTRRGRKEFKRRFDHIFACSRVQPVHCSYLHSFRERGLSDHSPIEALLKIT